METAPQDTQAVESFKQLAGEIVERYCAFYPGTAVDLGLHEYDGQVGDFSQAALDGRVRTVEAQLQRLAALDRAALPPDLAHDHTLAEFSLARELWGIRDFPSYQRIP